MNLGLILIYYTQNIEIILPITKAVTIVNKY